MSGLISSLAWVKRGAAARQPSKYVLDDAELERVSALARIELEDARVELERAHEAAKSMGKGAEGDEADYLDENEDDWVDEAEDSMDVDGAPPAEEDDAIEKYNLDEYDNDTKITESGPFSNIKGLTYYRNNEDDPYITLKEDPEDDERNDLEVLPTDNMIVIAKTEDDISQLEVYIYDELQENLYAHHDLMLPAFPLCLEWLDLPPSSSSRSSSNGFGNFIAVGTMEPEIEIWSLDITEAIYPDSVLGRRDKTVTHVPTPLGTGKKKKKKTKHRATSTAYHVDAVLSLSWNRTHRNFLASASADRTVKLWDLNRDPTLNGENDSESGGAFRSFDTIHKDRIQAVEWNQKDPSVLLSGSYDRTVRVFDTRAPDAGVGAVVGADVEALRWDPWEDHSFYVSLENGMVVNFDVRQLPSNLNNPSPARFTLAAHDGPVSAIDINPHIRGCILTGGEDRLVKVWNNVEDGERRNVSMVASRDLGVGKVFSAVWSPDDPLVLAAAGSKVQLQIWDVGANAGARQAFASKLAEAGKEVKAKEGSGGVIGVQSDGESDDEEEDE